MSVFASDPVRARTHLPRPGGRAVPPRCCLAHLGRFQPLPCDNRPHQSNRDKYTSTCASVTVRASTAGGLSPPPHTRVPSFVATVRPRLQITAIRKSAFLAAPRRRTPLVSAIEACLHCPRPLAGPAGIGATPQHHPITAARFDTAPSPDARLIPPQSGGEERQLPSVVIPPDAHGCAPIREGQDKRCSVPRRPAC